MGMRVALPVPVGKVPWRQPPESVEDVSHYVRVCMLVDCKATGGVGCVDMDNASLPASLSPSRRLLR